jgi:hypothetical protein
MHTFIGFVPASEGNTAWTEYWCTTGRLRTAALHMKKCLASTIALLKFIFYNLYSYFPIFLLWLNSFKGSSLLIYKSRSKWSYFVCTICKELVLIWMIWYYDCHFLSKIKKPNDIIFDFRTATCDKLYCKLLVFKTTFFSMIKKKIIRKKKL